MEILIRSTAAALASSAMCLMIKRFNPELSLLLGICTASIILASVLRAADSIRELTETVRSLTGLNGKYMVPILKCTAISITTKIGTSICRDASQTSAAVALELTGTICALTAAMPMLISMLGMIGELV